MQTRRTFLTALAGASAFALAACGSKPADDAAESTTETTEAAPAAAAGDGTDAKGDGVMTYADYAAAAVDDKVTVECFVQATQSWWENQITIYAADADGAYFIYNAACTEEDAAKLVEGQKIKVTGYKADFEGEVEITDGTIEIEDGSFIAEPVDVTDQLGSDKLIDSQNLKVAFTGMKVEASDDGAAFVYKGESAGDDIYFKASVDGATYDFTIESYLTDKDSDVYKAAESLKVGDTIDMVGFLYWYQGPNPHITSITVK